MDQTLHRVATKEREEIKGTTKQKTARRRNNEEGNHLDQENNRQTTMEDIGGWLHPAVDGQSQDDERRREQPVVDRDCQTVDYPSENFTPRREIDGSDAESSNKGSDYADLN